MCYNVTAPLDYCPFEKEVEIAECVREVVTVCQLCMWLCGFDDDSMKNSQYNENFAQKLRMFSV